MSKDGTKVLMVEWEDDEVTRNITGDWAVSWDGKQTVLPTRDTQEGGVNRLYFLLPGGERVPATVTLTLSPMQGDNEDEEAAGKPTIWKTNPLPAIFPPELGASAREAGKKGVLHTIWAKKRLSVLSEEIDVESKRNAEGIALQMAMDERDWIEHNFGVTTKPSSIAIPKAMSTVGLNHPTSPQSPRSPGGGRLMEKLKGLKLGTSERDLSHVKLEGTTSIPDEPPYFNPLSPEQSDVAVSSFGSFAALKGMPDPKTLAAKSPQATRRVAAQRPPESVLAQQRQAASTSLNAFGAQTGFSVDNRDDEKEDDLFALPMSPRSPDMGKSPFSFGVEDTIRYLKGGRA